MKEQLKFAYQSLLIVSLNQPPGQFYRNFSEEVKAQALENYNFTYNEPVVNYFTSSFHDSVLLLCRALWQTEQDDGFMHYNIDERRLRLLTRMKNITFKGVSGNVTIDSDGDRMAGYALLDQVDTKDGLFEVVLRYYGATRKYETIKKIHWPNGLRPVDVPTCGFDGSKCKRRLASFFRLPKVTI